MAMKKRRTILITYSTAVRLVWWVWKQIRRHETIRSLYEPSKIIGSRRLRGTVGQCFSNEPLSCLFTFACRMSHEDLSIVIDWPK
jgi:hypothetical protein